jgi:hypothetical protein
MPADARIWLPFHLGRACWTSGRRAEKRHGDVVVRAAGTCLTARVAVPMVKIAHCPCAQLEMPTTQRFGGQSLEGRNAAEPANCTESGQLKCVEPQENMLRT